jgi:hypothetical protein
MQRSEIIDELDVTAPEQMLDHACALAADGYRPASRKRFQFL